MNQEFISYAKYGQPHVIGVYKGQPVPIPSGDEVRVKVLASSVSYTDTLIRRNLYPEQPKLPIIPGYDICGTVDAVGDKVTRLKVGDLVCDLVVYGGNTRYIIRPETSLVKIPENTDPDQAAALTLSWVTAYQALFRPTKLVVNGTKVLIIGGTGAVGQALIKLVRHYGGKTYVTADSKDTAVLKELGADLILPKQSHYWLPKVYGEMDVVVDTVCEDYFKSSAKALKKDGHLVAVGMTHFLNKGSTWKAWWALTRLKFMKNASLYHIQQYRNEHPDHFVQDLTELCDLLNKGEIKVKIDKLIGFEEVAKCHELLESGGVLKGKVILKPWRNFEAASTAQ